MSLAQLGLDSVSNGAAHLLGVFEHIPAPVLIFHAKGAPPLGNGVFRELFGTGLPLLEDPGGPFAVEMRRALAGERGHVPTCWYETSGRTDGLARDRVACELTLAPLPAVDGQVPGVIVFFRDVTADVKLGAAAEALESTEVRFRATFEQAAVGIAHVAPDGAWLEVNQRLCDIVGYSREELRRLTFQDITHPPDLAADLELVRQVLAGERQTYSLEKRYIRKDSSLVWIDLTVSLVRSADGVPLYFISLVQDISRRKEAEESLATTLDCIGDAVIATDVQGHITRMNPVAELLTGWTLADARHRELQDVFRVWDEDARLEAPSPVSRALREGRVAGAAQRAVLVARGGQERPIADTAAPIRDASGIVHGVVLVFRDQTEERAAERALRRSEATQSAILRAALDCVVTADQDGLVTEFNPAAERTFGYQRAEIIGSPLVRLIPPDLRQRHADGFHRYLTTGVGPLLGKRVEITALKADGSEFPVELAVVPTRTTDSLFFTAYIRDMSEQRRAAEALQLSEARFKHLSDSGIIGIVLSDTLGNIHEANDAFLKLTGFSRDELVQGKLRWTDLTAPEWRSVDEEALELLRTTGVAAPWEKEYVRKDGTRTPVLVGVAMLEAPRCIAFALDLSSQRRAEEARAQAVSAAQREFASRARVERALEETEEQLRQSQKMEAIGVLAGSIAHDFNNLLSVILGYAELIVDELQAGDPIRDEVVHIRDAGRSASELTRQLLAFGRRQVLEPRFVDLNVTISNMMRMLRRIIGEDIELVVSLAPDLGATFVDPNQIEQVLLNLVVNARDAMLHGGRLSIVTTAQEVDADFAQRQLQLAPGRYVVLSVSDTGAGMDRATLVRIFEPFFTTKPMGKGTGLGLSTVYGIVKQSDGGVCVQSELGVGTSFNVFLPHVDAKVDSPSLGSRPPPRRGHETVLLVEDDEQVRGLASSVLRRHGYQVLQAAGGGDALLICEQFLGKIDILVTDVVMPHMSGRQLWERLNALRPAIRVLFMSGYTDDDVVRHGVLRSEFAFVQKPLVPGTLLSKLRQVLDGPKGALPPP